MSSKESGGKTPHRTQIKKRKSEVSVNLFKDNLTKYHYAGFSDSGAYPLSDWIGVGEVFTTDSHTYTTRYVGCDNKVHIRKSRIDGFFDHYKKYLGRKKKLQKSLARNIYIATGKKERVLTYFSFDGHGFKDDAEIQKLLAFIDLAERKAALLTNDMWNETRFERVLDRIPENSEICDAVEVHDGVKIINGSVSPEPDDSEIFDKYPCILHPLYYAQFPFICKYEFITDLRYEYKTDGIIYYCRNEDEFAFRIDTAKDRINSDGKKLYGSKKNIPERYFDNSVDMLDKGCLKYRTKYGIVHILEHDKLQPLLPTASHRCLWCGEEIPDEDHLPGRNRYFCSSSCNVTDATFNSSLKERLAKADMDYVLSKYAEYAASHQLHGSYDYSPESIDTLLSSNSDMIIKNMLFHYQSGQIPHKLLARWLNGPCKVCGKDIPLSKPLTTRYCSEDCRLVSKKKQDLTSWNKNKDRYSKKE